jgi:hypothetical protein
MYLAGKTCFPETLLRLCNYMRREAHPANRTLTGKRLPAVKFDIKDCRKSILGKIEIK